MGLALAGMQLFERHGAVHSRMLEPIYAGEHSDLYVLASELDGVERHGEFVDDLYTDSDFETFLARSSGPDSPLKFVSRRPFRRVLRHLSGPVHLP